MSQYLFANKNFSILSGYANTMNRDYSTRVDSINVDTKNDRHKSYDYINNFISNATHGQIEKAVHPTDLINAQLLLVSAMYFRADWMVSKSYVLIKLEFKKDFF